MPPQQQDSRASRRIVDIKDSGAAAETATSLTTSTDVANDEEAYTAQQIRQAHQQSIDDNDSPEHQQQQQQQQQVAVSRPNISIAERNRLLALSLQPQRVDIMAGRISELEGALAASERRVKSLVYSTAPTAAATAAAAASKSGKPDDVAGMRRRCAERVRQLEDVLVQAEKRSSWLQGELKLVSACAGEHIRELEDELLAAKVERCSRDSDCCSSPGTSTGSSSGGGGAWSSSGRDVDKLRETHKALASLRRKFYRAMKEKNELKSKCDKVTEELYLRTKHRDQLAQELESVKSTTTGCTAPVADATEAIKQRKSVGKEPNKSSSCSDKTSLALKFAPNMSYAGDFSWRWPAPGAPASGAGN